MLYCQKSGRHYTTSGGWFPCEEIVLKGMIQDGYSYRKMCHVLSREYQSVHKKVSLMRC